MKESLPDKIFLNGIHGHTGDYLLAIPPDAMMAAALSREGLDDLSRESRTRIYDALTRKQEREEEVSFSLQIGRDASDLSQAGWGVIFPAALSEPVRQGLVEALKPLREWRKEQADAGTVPYYKEFIAPSDAVAPGEDAQTWFLRHGASLGDVRPEFVPYYMLLVGSPQEISFRFQAELDINNLVGRIYFSKQLADGSHTHDLEAYARYAESVVAAEKRRLKLPRRMVFFSPVHEGDTVSQTTYESLVQPLASGLRDRYTSRGWRIESVAPPESTHARLEDLLGRQDAPAFLFSATHGVGFDAGDPAQQAYQGGLLCQDHSSMGQAVQREHFLAAEDLSDDFHLHGLVAFLHNTFSAGTPNKDLISTIAHRIPRPLTQEGDFQGALPSRLLSHPKGGALAVIGYTDRTWSYSYPWLQTHQQTATYEAMLGMLMTGIPLGLAIDRVNARYAQVAVSLQPMLDHWDIFPQSPEEVLGLWTANNDSHSLFLLGDPAVQLAVAEVDETAEERQELTFAYMGVSSTETELATKDVPSIEGVPGVKEDLETLEFDDSDMRKGLDELGLQWTIDSLEATKIGAEFGTASPAFDKEQDNPYVGPRPFEKGDKFFGRDREKNDLRNLLIGRRVVLLHSPSGAGKTSLIQAGLGPMMESEMAVLPVVRVHLPPPTRLLDQTGDTNRYLLSAIISLEGKEEHPEEITNLASLIQMGLGGYIKKRLDALPLPDEAFGWLLIFDQFEEILSMDPTDLDAKRKFFTEVGQLLSNSNLYALFAMRDDYTGSMEPYFRYLPEGLRHRFRLDLLTVAQAIEAARGPALVAETRVDFQESAIQEMVADLSTVQVQQPDGSQISQSGPYVEPVQLSVVCDWLWKNRQHQHEITRKDFEKLRLTIQSTDDKVETLNIVDRALQDFYDAELTSIASAVPASGQTLDPSQMLEIERAMRGWFESQLIASQRLRNQVLKDARQSQGLDNSLIDALVKRHLVRAEQRRGLTWFELAHDRLVEPVKRSNRTWFADPAHRMDFQITADRWQQQGRHPSFLLALSELDAAKQQQARYPDLMRQVDLDFLRANEYGSVQFLEVERGLNISDLGWGVIFPATLPSEQLSALQAAMKELLDFRQEQAGEKRVDYFKSFDSFRGYQRGESAYDFLKRHGANTGVNTPDKVPYYLLIVGTPEEIPFEFQYGLDERYAVGRIAFDHLEDYARYARSVVSAEKGLFALPKQVALFGPAHEGDRATHQSSRVLVKPMADELMDLYQSVEKRWAVKYLPPEESTRNRLADSLGRSEAPAVVFVASHGFQSKRGEPNQEALGGALICQDFPGPGKPLVREHFLAAEDIDDGFKPLGLVAFLLAAYSVGTPRQDNFPGTTDNTPKEIAQRDFLAALPKRLLSHPNGGALAVIGHVDRIWTYSFSSESPGEGLQPDIGAISLTLKRLLDGHTAGSALEVLNQRYATFNNLLADMLINKDVRGVETKPGELYRSYIRTIDARNYILLGDPAVRLPVQDDVHNATHPTIEPVGEIGMTTRAAPVEFEKKPPVGKAEIDQGVVVLNGIWQNDGTPFLKLEWPVPSADITKIFENLLNQERIDRENLRLLNAWYEAKTRGPSF